MDTGEDVRTEAGELSCEVVREALAGLALDEPLGVLGRGVARHAAHCKACDAFADDLAESRAGLFAPVVGVNAESAARQALEEQLRARLARDLLARARSEAPRPPAERAWDLERLAALALGRPAATSLTRRVERVLAEARPPRARILGLAARLDPIGVDVALAWIGFLVHAGRRHRAERVADRLLRDLPGLGR